MKARHLLLLFLAILITTTVSGQRFGNPEERADQNTQRLIDNVEGITDVQKEQVRTIFLKYVKLQQTLIQNTAGDRQTLMQEMQALRAEQNREIQAVLSESQQEQYQAYLQSMRGNFAGRQNRQQPSNLVPPGVIQGTVIDPNDSATILSVNVILRHESDSSVIKLAVTQADGKFKLEGVPSGSYLIQTSHVAFNSTWQSVTLRRRGLDVGFIGMSIKDIVLQEVTKEGQIPPVTQKGDTVQYNAAAYKTLPDASAEDLITKMPGITVENGTVQAQGEDVQKVLVDGREFFGDDPNIALRTLPAEVIEKIEVFDRLSDQSQFTGFDDGNTQKTINIITREDKRNGQFGKLSAGVGTDNRYTVNANTNLFKNDTRVSLIAMSNNINQQNFSTQDLLGVVSSSSNRMRQGFGGMRGAGGGNAGGGPGGGLAGRGGGGNVNNFLVGNQNGITTTHSFGINFNDIWGKKLTITGSYFFNMSDNDNTQFINRQYLFQNDITQFYDEANQNDSRNFNHRFNMRMTYTIDDRNSIIFTPRVNVQSYDGLSRLFGQTYVDSTSFLNRTLNDFNNNNAGYNASGNLLWRHRFDKQRRTLSVNINSALNDQSGDNRLMAINEFNDRVYTVDSLNQISDVPAGGYTIGGNIRYTEPVGKRGMVQLNYRVNYSDSYSNKKTWNFDENAGAFIDLDTALSNKFQNGYLTNLAGASYRLGDRSKMLMAGINYQIADLQSEQTFPQTGEVKKTFNNLLPNLMFRRQFTRSKTLMLFYRTSTNAPSISQLQNVVDNSNPLLLSAGNPDLKQEYTHQLVSRYSNNNVDKMSSFFVFFVLRNTQNKINNATFTTVQDTVIAGVDVPSGVQLNIPVNVDGYWNARTFVTYGIPLGKLKSNLNLNGGITYTRAPGFSNQIANISNTYALNQSTVLASNISTRVDFSLSYNATYNIVRNEIQPNLNSDYVNLNSAAKLNWIIWKGIVLRTQLVHQRYEGLSDGFNQNYTLWNATLGKKVFKNQLGEIQVSVFDLLNQNTNISRNVTETYIEDVQTEMIGQYFMLSFVYNLRKFKSGDS